MAARRKAPARQAPATLAEATELAARYVAVNHEIEHLDAIGEAMIAGIKEELDLKLAPLQEEARAIFDQLRSWWPTARADVAGDRRSIELAGAQIGERLSPPAVVLRKGLTVKAAIDAVAEQFGRASAYLRTKLELDRAEILKGIQAEPEGELARLGFAVGQADEFFIAVRPIAGTESIGEPE
ncbi:MULTISPECIES: host-nuclease inhibitor Gam family protein [unclassified Sphingomonas]|jgi:phage host-nuclease inhibitor protein Gam|uniref:host-nuclease inhibitor Gam family protein n=1 Tax=unclassified Sphingomonas TaxID=196159 RepID=UPI000831B644|nr:MULTISPECIES: host-nuclease inhibitor Gam family protein [unclassified Sphingomonas]